MTDTGTQSLDAPADRFSGMIGIRQDDDAPLRPRLADAADRIGTDAEPVDCYDFSLHGLFYRRDIITAFHYYNFSDHLLFPLILSSSYYN